MQKRHNSIASLLELRPFPHKALSSGPLSLTWINFNFSMNWAGAEIKQPHAQ